MTCSKPQIFNFSFRPLHFLPLPAASASRCRFEQNCWTGTFGQGTLGALPIELLARRTAYGPGGIRIHILPRDKRSNPALHHVQPLSRGDGLVSNL